MRKVQGVGELSIADFEMVIALAQRLSLAAVARERDTSASQVSRALARVERLCGSRLFHRTTHGLSVTQEGRLVVEQGQRITGDARTLAEQLVATREGAEGQVRLSVSQILGEQVLVPAVDGLCERYPGLRLELQFADRLVDIATDAIDIAVRAGVAPLDTRLAHHLGSHGRRLYASPSFIARHGAPQRLEDLQDFRLVSNSGVTRQNQWRFSRDGLPVTLTIKGDVQADNTSTTLSLALAGAGIARLNDVVARRHVERDALVEVLDAFADEARHDIHAIALASRFRVSRVRAVMGWLRTTFAAAGFASDARGG